MLPEYRTIYNQLSKGGLRDLPLPPSQKCSQNTEHKISKSLEFLRFPQSIPLAHNVLRQANCYEPLFQIILDKSKVAV